jgi:hypothetical protein
VQDEGRDPAADTRCTSDGSRPAADSGMKKDSAMKMDSGMKMDTAKKDTTKKP